MATRQLSTLGGHPEGFAATMRADRWWVAPASTVFGLLAFAVYVTWAAFQGEHYYASPYLSPLYSPVIYLDPSAAGAAPLWHVWFKGPWPAWWPDWLPRSPAFFILVFPGVFRFTCYYYRKAYYRSFTASPPACAVSPGATGRAYRGETAWLIFQNLHRYTMYFAVAFIFILTFDALAAFFHDGRFGIGVGTVVLLLNAVLLGAYTFGCHSLRHLVGGHDDCMSCGKATLRLKLWRGSSALNVNHMKFAWASLIWVGLTDLYVRLVSMGVIHDLNTWGH
jgi:hypothetical protein